MAVPALSAFIPAETITLLATAAGASVALPTAGAPTTALVTNTGEVLVAVALGSSSVTTTYFTGQVIAPGQTVPLVIGSNTNLAATAISRVALLSIAVGS